MVKDRKWIWMIVAVLAALLVIYIGIRWWNRDVVSVKTTIVLRGSIEEIISASGTVNAPVYDLGTKFGGKIGDLRVKEGNFVKKGQLLCEFDNYEQARNDFERTKKLYDDGAASKQSLDAARTMFESSRIIAPDDGIVAKVNYREGETVVPGQPEIVVVNYDQSWVEAQIDEIDIANIKIGNKVKIASDVYSNKVFDGEIYWIAPLAELRKVGGRVKMDEESYVFPAKIRFINGHEELKVNMSVNVDIVTKKHDNALLIPREALASMNDHSVVFAVRKNRVYEQTVMTGIKSFTSVEAIAGVSEGDLIAVSNLSKLNNKARVKIER